MSKPLPSQLKKELARNYIGTSELCALTGSPTGTFNYAIKQGKLPAIKVDNDSPCGYKFMIAKEDAIKFLESRGEDVPSKLVKFKVFADPGPDVDSMPSEPVEDRFMLVDLGRNKVLKPQFRQVTFIDRVQKYLLTLSLALAGKI